MRIDSAIGKKSYFNKFRIHDILSIAEFYTIITLSVFVILSIVLFGSIQEAWKWIIYNFLVSGFIISVAVIDKNTKFGKHFSLFRRLYIVFVVFFVYTQVQIYIRAMNPGLYDETLIKWDFAIFGTHPTRFFKQFYNPILTEYLQFAYFTFFFLPVSHGLELFFSKKEEEFNTLVAFIVFSFYFSYLMYFFMPAIGPRFTIHEFSAISREMPGIWLTDFFRSFIDTGGGIPLGIANPEIYTNRDCMPSGHTWITIVNIYLAYKFASKTRWIYYILGFSLIFSTIYLRYHYVVDIIAGIFFAILTIIIEPKIKNMFNKYGFGKQK
jgi:membrane-associated phospholipid phosphatase